MNEAQKGSTHHEREEWGEKWSRDALGSVVGGLIVVWLGICFLVITNGPWRWDDLWQYFLGGVGVIFLLEVAVRSVIPEYRRPVLGKLIAGVILLAIGFGGLVGLETWWPLILIVIGASIILGVLMRSKKPQ